MAIKYRGRVGGNETISEYADPAVTGGRVRESQFRFDQCDLRHNVELAAAINGRSGIRLVVSTGKGAAHTIYGWRTCRSRYQERAVHHASVESRLEPGYGEVDAWMTTNLTSLPSGRLLVYPEDRRFDTQGLRLRRGMWGRAGFTMDLGTKDVYSRAWTFRTLPVLGESQFAGTAVGESGRDDAALVGRVRSGERLMGVCI